MPEADQEPQAPESRPSPERVGDALRTAVERTLAASAGSASETGQRARDLLDELVKRGESAREELGRRGEAARDQVGRRRDAAREDFSRRGEEASRRLAGAIAELNLVDRADLGPLGERLAAIEGRLGDLERVLRRDALERAVNTSDSNPEVEGENDAQREDSGA